MKKNLIRIFLKNGFKYKKFYIVDKNDIENYKHKEAHINS
tara:strand:- start:584 stop:703 length:120 start_codon:yes stop_codon:yes gene_type:complete